MSVVLLAAGLGSIWHGAQIVWVAPRPSQFVKNKPELEPGSARAFQRFWLDQYAWIGFALIAIGIALCAGSLA